eukprot:GILK01007512.1.p1 GENE.GILK01007512.1~~GILK01007512.1.p1  ORF type:complete len:346 (+),score=36.72 GILK01007512.1:29-1066(+)
MSISSRLRGALWGLFVGDAIAMPVHWYYDVDALKTDYGRITNYENPKEKHPTSIMGYLGAVDIVGSSILHHAKPYWGKADAHYHASLTAGENTLNARLAGVVMRALSEKRAFDGPYILSEYIKFMTTPGSHNDSYVEKAHREFFQKLRDGTPPTECAAPENDDTACAGAMVTLLPTLLFDAATTTRENMVRDTLLQMNYTHKSEKMGRYATLCGNMLTDMLNGKDMRTAIQETGTLLELDIAALAAQNRPDTEVCGEVFMPNCYIVDSFPLCLYFAYRYADSFEDAILANTNVGGDNVYRGAILGVIMGLGLGEDAIPSRFIEGLVAKDAIRADIDKFVQCVVAP